LQQVIFSVANNEFSFDVTSNPVLTEIICRGMASLGGSIVVASNPLLTTLNINYLSLVAAASYILIDSNPSLTSLSLMYMDHLHHAEEQRELENGVFARRPVRALHLHQQPEDEFLASPR